MADQPTLVVKALLNSSLVGALCNVIIFVGGALNVIHGGVFGSLEAGDQHLRQSNILCPGDAALLVFPQLVESKVRTDAGDTCIAEYPAKLSPRVFAEAAEACAGVPNRRAQLNGFESRAGQRLDRAWEILRDHLPDRPRLASDGQAQRIGAKLQGASGHESGNRGIGGRKLQKISSRNGRHRFLLLSITSVSMLNGSNSVK